MSVMTDSFESDDVVRLRVEDSLLGGGFDMRSHKAEQTRWHTFYSSSSGRDVSFSKVENEVKWHISDATVNVIGLEKPSSDVFARMKRLLTERTEANNYYLFVTNPDVYNVPDFRRYLNQDDHAEVVVCEIDKFKMDILTPWIHELLASGMEERSRIDTIKTDAVAISSLDISKRFRDPSNGRLNASKIAKLFGIKGIDMAAICEVTKQAISKTPASSGIQEKLEIMDEIAELLHWCGGDEEKFRAWLRKPNRDFPPIDGKVPSPLELIRKGHADIVVDKVRNLLSGHPA